MKNLKSLIYTILIIVIILGAVFLFTSKEGFEDGKISEVNDFQECFEAGYQIMESYPRQCHTPAGEVFVEEIDYSIKKDDLIKLAQPKPDQVIESPLRVRGEARGSWFFEGNFPVILTDWDGLIIAEGYATAQDSWMTEEYISFEADLSFEKPSYGENGFLILRKANPSGLAENDDALEIRVRF